MSLEGLVKISRGFKGRGSQKKHDEMVFQAAQYLESQGYLVKTEFELWRNDGKGLVSIIDIYAVNEQEQIILETKSAYSTKDCLKQVKKQATYILNNVLAAPIRVASFHQQGVCQYFFDVRIGEPRKRRRKRKR